MGSCFLLSGHFRHSSRELHWHYPSSALTGKPYSLFIIQVIPLLGLSKHTAPSCSLEGQKAQDTASVDLNHDIAADHRLQPNLTTQAHQVELWSQLILDWSRAERVFMVDVEAGGGDLCEVFENKTIKRESGGKGSLSPQPALYSPQSHHAWTRELLGRCWDPSFERSGLG
jgi:hypothetical protein